ncbi:MAG: hypothetical protein WA131_11705 [Desulfitobacteriaceae bacterium]
MGRTEPGLIKLLVEEVAQQLAEINLQEDALWYFEHLATMITELQLDDGQ